MTTPPFEANASAIGPEIRRLYATATAGVNAGVAVTMLHIGTEQVVVVAGSGNKPAAAMVLELGAARTAREHFRHEPPTPHEMEHAIMTVEEEVIRARTLIVDDSRLLTGDAGMREVARFAGVSDSGTVTISIDRIEQAFGRIAAVTLGRPASQEGVPADNAFAARLLILRECMHHLRFPSVMLTA